MSNEDFLTVFINVDVLVFFSRVRGQYSIQGWEEEVISLIQSRRSVVFNEWCESGFDVDC